jgi:hypothetical protein
MVKIGTLHQYLKIHCKSWYALDSLLLDAVPMFGLVQAWGGYLSYKNSCSCLRSRILSGNLSDSISWVKWCEVIMIPLPCLSSQALCKDVKLVNPYHKECSPTYACRSHEILANSCRSSSVQGYIH